MPDKAKWDARVCELTGLLPYRASEPEDIFIAGHPKSGTTWFQNLVAGVVFGVDPEYAPYALVRDLVPGHMQKYYRRYATPTYFKTHLKPRQRFRRVVYLVRDGRDVMVSYYHHLKAELKREVDFMEVVQARDVIWPYKWHEHVEAWLENPFNADLLVIRYEDLKADTVQQLERFCAFAGIERQRSFLAHIAEKASFQKLREKEIREGSVAFPDWPRGQLFMRRGQVGSYRDEMPADVLQAFLKDAGSTLRKLGYSVDELAVEA